MISSMQLKCCPIEGKYVLHDFTLEPIPTRPGYVAVTPTFNYSEITCAPHLDTIVITIRLKEAKPWNWLKKRIDLAINRAVHISEKFDEGKFDKHEHNVTIQDPLRSDLENILKLSFIEGSPQIVRLEACLDYRRNKHTDVDADNLFRENLVSVLARTRRLHPNTIKGSGGPRYLDENLKTQILRHGKGLMSFEYQPVPNHISKTFYYGQKNGPLSGRIYAKAEDKRNLKEDTFTILTNSKRSARDEVILRRKVLVQQLGVSTVSDLLKTDFKFQTLARYFRYELPIVPDTPLLGTRRPLLAWSGTGTWACKERRPRRKKSTIAFGFLNKKSTQAWKRFSGTWHQN